MQQINLIKYLTGMVSLLVLLLVSTANTVQAQGFENFSDDPAYATNFRVLKYDNVVNAALESRIETFTIEIPQLGGRQRNIQVYMPPDYDSSDKQYPVFYVFDGAYLFNPPSHGIGDYAVDETMDRLFVEGLVNGVIVVGIEHDFDNEWSEYIPWINENMHDWVTRTNSARVEGGEGFAYLDFIVNTLKPEIDSRYKTLPDRENTAIGGFCRMGILPVVAAVEYPQIFSGVMAMSPAVWMAEGDGRWLSNNRLIQYLNDNPIPENVKFYVDIGTEEFSGNRPPVRDQNGDRITYPRAYVEGAQALENALRTNGVPEENIYFRIIEGVEGKRDIWAQRIGEVVLWLFTDGQTDPDITSVETPMDEKPPSNSQELTTEDEESPEDEALPENEVFLPGIQNQENAEQQDDSRIGIWIALGFGIVVVSFGLVYRLMK